jgi:hypothetical protein
MPQQKTRNRFGEAVGASLFTTAEGGRGEVTGACRGLLWPDSLWPAKGPRPASPMRTAEERKPVGTAGFVCKWVSLRHNDQKN